jgi:hypothetical protein
VIRVWRDGRHPHTIEPTQSSDFDVTPDPAPRLRPHATPAAVVTNENSASMYSDDDNATEGRPEEQVEGSSGDEAGEPEQLEFFTDEDDMVEEEKSDIE